MYFQATLKHGGGGLMVWGCISTVGIGKLIFIDDILDKNKYLNILKENLKYNMQWKWA